ncbi:YybH family protein [Shouchella hunanensis]|uniref:Nuclear transport factor 2 family protein n=1 Tax=Shouchella hunanensis TaxID=766894 RepID=A0ABY7WD79_9BACI|nr:nuclear transport factor 2 family protein [Shouchella hunanensis]WDF05815.1 nuclear transport factor 2 family protein [Shouchella hunanensis]
MHYEQALERYIEATNTHRFSEVEKVLHSEAVFWFTNQNCVTRKDIKTFFETAWTHIKEEVYEATEVKWMITTEQAAMCTYTYTYKGYQDGVFVSGKGRATNAFVLENGEWKLIHEHLSAMPQIEGSKQ